MLRNQVITQWNDLKKKMIEYKKTIDSLTEQLEFALPTFPLGYWPTRSRLDSWTDFRYQTTLNQSKEKIYDKKIESESLLTFQFNCINAIDMFKELTEGWKKERDSRDGPTIIEVD